jgi:hypothetical protein
MLHQFIQNKAMGGCEFTLQGVHHVVPACLQPPTGQLDDFFRGLPLNQGLDHRSGRLAMKVADDHT